MSFAEVESSSLDALLLTGDFAPDKLRRDPKALQLTREFERDGKCIAHICHAGWICISANILRGRRATSTVGIKDDMANAGAICSERGCAWARKAGEWKSSGVGTPPAEHGPTQAGIMRSHRADLCASAQMDRRAWANTTG